MATTSPQLASPLFSATVPIVRPELPRDVEHAEMGAHWERIVASGLLTNGKQVERFERRAAELLGVSECVATSSCTVGLMLVMRCLDLSGEIILPSFTFFASGHAALWNGLEPVLVDCERDSFNIDPQRVREAITERTSAILAVHVFGNPAAVQELEAIAAMRRLKLIFDAAHAFGARSGARPLGGGGDAEVFSLSPTKLLVAGEGGLVTTNDRELARKLRMARNYGDGGSYDCEILGLNGRMTEMQAALAAAGLQGIGERLAARNRMASIYESILGEHPGIQVQQIDRCATSSRKDFAILINEAEFGASRDFVRAALESDNVQCRAYFDPPLHRQKLYQGCRRGDVSNAEWISRRVLSLPIYSSLPPAAAEAIARRILSIRKNT